MLTVQYPLQDI